MDLLEALKKLKCPRCGEELYLDVEPEEDIDLAKGVLHVYAACYNDDCMEDSVETSIEAWFLLKPEKVTLTVGDKPEKTFIYRRADLNFEGAGR